MYCEEYSFEVRVIALGPDGRAEHCRNGHEVGDVYRCAYSCPDGLCSKSMFKLFPLMETVRACGDFSNLLAGAQRHSGTFTCPDGVVSFKLEARKA